MTVKYFVYPFGVAGTLLAIPDPTQLSGVMSYQEGFGVDYQLVDTDPSSLNIPRDQFNQLMNDITGAIQQVQQNGHPTFITTAMNDGSPFPYAKNAWVYQPVDGNVYYSLVDSNTTVPPSSSWSVVGQTASLYFNYAPDTGSANLYVTAPSPPVPAYAAGDFIILKPTQANTGASTINVNGLGAKNIKLLTNQDPSAGAMIPSGTYALVYDGTNFVLLNPTLGTAAYLNVGTSPNNVVQLDGSSRLPAVDGSQLLNLPGYSLDPATYMRLFDDFNYSTDSITPEWTSTVSGTGATITSGYSGIFAFNAAEINMGLVVLNTGTTTSGSAQLTKGAPNAASVYVGTNAINYIWRIRLPTVSTSGQRFTTSVGLLDGNVAFLPQEGIYFRQIDNVNSGNWQAVAVHSTTETVINSSVAGSTAAIILQATINAAGTSVEFFINGISIGSITTNLPTGANHLQWGAQVIKSAGTTARQVYVDYLSAVLARI